MAISTDALIDVFGTQDTVTSSSSAVTDGSFSVSGDITTWTNDDDAPQASVTFEGTIASGADANSTVSLFARMLNTQSTNDNEAPDANFQHVLLAEIPLNDVTSAQYITVDVDLPNSKTSQEYDFYIRNNAGNTISAGWDLYVTPKTVAPHA